MIHSAENRDPSSPFPRNPAQPDLELPDAAEKMIRDDVNSKVVEIMDSGPNTASDAESKSSSPGIGRIESVTNPGEHTLSLPATAVDQSTFSDAELPVPLGVLPPPGVMRSASLILEVAGRRYQSLTWKDNHEAFDSALAIVRTFGIVDIDANADTGSSCSHSTLDDGSL